MIIRLRSRDGLERIQVGPLPAPAVEYTRLGDTCISVVLCLLGLFTGSFSRLAHAYALAFCEAGLIDPKTEQLPVG